MIHLPQLNINKVIQILILSDVVLFFAVGLFTPILAIYITNDIEGGSLTAVGTAVALYWVGRLVTTVPLSRFMDRTDGEKDEYYFMVIGTLITAVIFILFAASTKVWHIYALQLVFGMVNSMVVPAWRIMFTNHLDRERTGYYWSMEDVGLGVAIASSAFFGAILAQKFGFDFVLYIVAGLAVISSFVMATLKKYTYSFKELKRLSKERREFRPLTKHKAKNHTS